MALSTVQTHSAGRIPEVLGADAQRGLAEFEPRVDLSMGRKIIEIP